MTELTELVRKVVKARGIAEADLDAFLYATVNDLPAAGELGGIDQAADGVLAAVRAGGEIVVFGDYDCDGIAATAILVRAIRALGARVSAFVPMRLKEGYGMSAAAVERLLKRHPGVRLVVTVDNGINSVAEIAALKARGVEVVVTDHHLPGAVLPDAVIVNPRLAAPEPFKELCGAAVAFLLVRELFRRRFSACPHDSPGISPFLVLAGLATVTDVMPLKGVNRILVKESLSRFAAASPVGLKALVARAGVAGAVTTRTYGFGIGPRINAVGRMAPGDEAELAVELLLADEAAAARELAEKVEEWNRMRRDAEQAMLAAALPQVVPDAPAQVIVLESGHPGVIGIVAARVMDRLPHPVPVAVIVDGHGSARAPAGHNVRDELAAAADALERFGGHALAAGFTLKAGAEAEFRRLFTAAAAAVPIPAVAAERIDAEVTAAELTPAAVRQLELLSPFGEGNPEPVFRLAGVQVAEVRAMSAARHLSFTAAGIRCVWWGAGERADKLASRAPVAKFDLVFTAGLSDYGGEQHVELVVRELKESTGG